MTRIRQWVAVILGVIILGTGAAGGAEAAPSPEVQAAESFSRGFRQVARQAGPAVVSIVTSRTMTGHPPIPEELFGELPPPFHRFGPFPDPRRGGQPRRRYEARGQGSGVVVDAAKGVILTNHHVVESAEKVTVHLKDGRELPGKVLGTDPKTDLAVIRVDAKGLEEAPLGDSDAMETGDWVVAIGAPFGLEQTVTAGIVSAKGRADVNVIQNPYAEQDFIQTDAAINPGNSGGPLLNLRGEVVGINTAIAGATGGNLGVGFAIPSNQARRVMAQLLENGKVVRGWLGIGIQDLTPDLAQQFDVAEGVVIGKVEAGSPAAEGGLQAGDVLVAIGDEKVPNTKTLRRRVAASSVGSPLPILVVREGKEKTLTVTVGEQPGDTLVAGEPEETEDGELGLSVQAVTPELAEQLGLDAGEEGVVVTRVAPGSPASEKGLTEGAVILSVNRRPVDSPAAFRKALAQTDPAKGVLLRVRQEEGTRWVVLRK